MVRAGPRNLITDVDSILVGNAEDSRALTGATVVLPDAAAIASGDVRGGGPGTRETDLLDPAATVDSVHAIALSGGSAFGLATADGVMSWLAARKRGFDVAGSIVPLVPGAILFDLNNGGDKAWGELPPYRALGVKACENAGKDFALGNAGAGLGARAGNLKGGLGSASSVDDAGLQVGALIAVNSRGYVTMEGQKQFWAWPFEQNGEFGNLPAPTKHVPLEVSVDRGAAAAGTVRGHTTIGVVATNAKLSKAEARRIAIMAQDGLARAIRPIHTSFDGDALFVLATGTVELQGVRPLALSRLGSIAADCVARAVARGVYEAKSAGGMVCWREAFSAQS
jgi:L-aminopeptidase/D-esterase-like protein